MIIRHLFPAGWHHLCTCSQESQLIVSFKLATSGFCFWLLPSFWFLLCPREDSVSATKPFVLWFFFLTQAIALIVLNQARKCNQLVLFFCVCFCPFSQQTTAIRPHFPPCSTIGPDLASYVADSLQRLANACPWSVRVSSSKDIGKPG